jgi:hypothetical protein
VLDYLGQFLADRLASGAQLSDLDAVIDRQLRVIARTTLDGYSVASLQTRFPYIADRVEELRLTHPTERSARLTAAHVTALQLGWRLFGDFLRSSTGLDDLTDGELAQSLSEAISSIDSAARARKAQ